VGRSPFEQQRAGQHLRGHAAPGDQAGLVAELEVDAAAHARASRLRSRGREAVVVASRPARHDGEVEGDRVVAEETREDGRSGRAERAVAGPVLR